ncbi:hypothetical protein [Mycobacteroides abscessus]|uniref:hypothetical protein n=1 Tax=Mycobacteroides abscessus TaxID=36809 RepID=UPI0009261F41|nr:hypothetical protein [Mycobacteroides abscessus]SIB66623.1 Uncharacterised protein [Mycobacteroides abscessus subsp. abscessus]
MITLDDARESIGTGVSYSGIGTRKHGVITGVEDCHVLVHFEGDPPLSTERIRPGDLSFTYRMGKSPMVLAVLFSHASSIVFEDLVSSERFTCRLPASSFAGRIARIQGVEFEIMELVGGRWKSRTGETSVGVIRRRWQS